MFKFESEYLTNGFVLLRFHAWRYEKVTETSYIWKYIEVSQAVPPEEVPTIFKKEFLTYCAAMENQKW